MDGDARRKKAMERLLLTIGLFFVLSVVAFILLGVFGCTTPGVFPGGKADGPLVAPVTQVSATWGNEVAVTSDVVNHGALLPGLAGRLYLFGADPGHPVKGDGKLTVELFDLGQRGPGGAPIQRWVFDKITLNRLLRKDLIGWGYTIFCPWPDYRPELRHFEVRVCFEPENGTPVFAPLSKINLRPSEAVLENAGQMMAQAARPKAASPAQIPTQPEQEGLIPAAPVPVQEPNWRSCQGPTTNELEEAPQPSAVVRPQQNQ
jgi:hypothetical protein